MFYFFSSAGVFPRWLVEREKPCETHRLGTRVKWAEMLERYWSFELELTNVPMLLSKKRF
jgi:hypothetical protein